MRVLTGSTEVMHLRPSPVAGSGPGRYIRPCMDTLPQLTAALAGRNLTNAEWGGGDFTCVSRVGADIYLSEASGGNP